MYIRPVYNIVHDADYKLHGFTYKTENTARQHNCDAMVTMRLKFFLLKSPEFSNSGFCLSLLRGNNTKHLVISTSVIMLTKLYNSPECYDHFLNRGKTKPYLTIVRTGSLRMK